MVFFSSSAGVGSFTAPVDLLLVEARVQLFTDSHGGGFSAHLIGFHPDLVMQDTDFQLVTMFFEGGADLGVDPVSRNNFENLRIPLVKGNAIYWASSATQQFLQLFFEEVSAQTVS